MGFILSSILRLIVARAGDTTFIVKRCIKGCDSLKTLGISELNTLLIQCAILISNVQKMLFSEFLIKIKFIPESSH